MFSPIKSSARLRRANIADKRRLLNSPTNPDPQGIQYMALLLAYAHLLEALPVLPKHLPQHPPLLS